MATMKFFGRRIEIVANARVFSGETLVEAGGEIAGLRRG